MGKIPASDLRVHINHLGVKKTYIRFQVKLICFDWPMGDIPWYE